MNDPLHIPGTRPEGCSEFRLARWKAGELESSDAASMAAHVAACARCGPRLADLEHHARLAGPRRAQTARRWRYPVGLALAASLALVFVVPDETGPNRRKGMETLAIYVGGTDAQSRLASPGERLAAGERIRLGWTGDEGHFVSVIAIDEAGEITPLATGRIEGSAPTLDDEAFELTGEGRERIVALFSDEPLSTERIVEAARRRFREAGSLERMAPLDLPAQESATILWKP